MKGNAGRKKKLFISVLYEDYQEYGSAFRLWANSESKLSDTLMAVSKSLDYSIENLKSIVSIPFKRKGSILCRLGSKIYFSLVQHDISLMYDLNVSIS